MVLFISPPFGNYLSWLQLPYVRTIKGSYTVAPRDGKWSQIFKTLRYSFLYQGWVNKIGLRNPGIDVGMKDYRPSTDIISVAIKSPEDCSYFQNILQDDTNIEVNISCPNVSKEKVLDELSGLLHENREWCILKVSPLTTIEEIDSYYQLGFRQFHCGNTLPTSECPSIKYEGGLSGPHLLSYQTTLIEKIKERYPDTEIIGGGGIRNIETSDFYKYCGATHVSVSSLCFNPLLFTWFYGNYWFQQQQKDT